eukprot:1139833-Pelagomonas_calceolata.AAC.3
MALIKWTISTLPHTHICSPVFKHIILFSLTSATEAWSLSPGATDALVQMREAGILLAVVSNFDTRLRQVGRPCSCLEHCVCVCLGWRLIVECVRSMSRKAAVTISAQGLIKEPLVVPTAGPP